MQFIILQLTIRAETFSACMQRPAHTDKSDYSTTFIQLRPFYHVNLLDELPLHATCSMLTRPLRVQPLDMVRRMHGLACWVVVHQQP